MQRLSRGGLTSQKNRCSICNMDTPKDTPKPCPFCGSPVEFVQINLEWCIRLRCKRGCVFQDLDRFGFEDNDKDRALNSWNQRQS